MDNWRTLVNRGPYALDLDTLQIGDKVRIALSDPRTGLSQNITIKKVDIPTNQDRYIGVPVVDAHNRPIPHTIDIHTKVCVAQPLTDCYFTVQRGDKTGEPCPVSRYLSTAFRFVLSTGPHVYHEYDVDSFSIRTAP